MRADLEKIVWAVACHPRIRSWKFTLLNLCHHANQDGEAFPGVATVARETGYSGKAVSDALAGLEAMGIIRRKGHCGQRQRVSVYDLSKLSTNVHNLANSEVSSCLQHFNSELSSEKGPFNGELTSPNGELSSARSILGNKEVSKLVCGGGNSEVTSPFVDNSRKGAASVAPSALKDEGGETGAEDYGWLLKTPGWKPRTHNDRNACMARCYVLGANRYQAEKFVRFNAIRRWTCCDYGTVNDAAKEWVAKWRKDFPDEYGAERERRKRADATRTLK
jgi:hypothetical protein